MTGKSTYQSDITRGKRVSGVFSYHQPCSPLTWCGTNVTSSSSCRRTIYGRLLVTNSHASSVETVAVIMASNNTDDTTTVNFPIAPLTTPIRRVLGPGTGVNISVVQLLESICW